MWRSIQMHGKMKAKDPYQRILSWHFWISWIKKKYSRKSRRRKLVICKETRVKMAFDPQPMIFIPSQSISQCEGRTKVFSDFSNSKNKLLSTELYFIAYFLKVKSWASHKCKIDVLNIFLNSLRIKKPVKEKEAHIFMG